MNVQFTPLQFLYFHSTGSGNLGSACVVTTKRTYVIDIAQASTPNSVQFTQNEKILRVDYSVKTAAAGKLEVSRVSAPQIGTTPATQDVLFRVDIEPVTTSGLPLLVGSWSPA